MTTRGGSSLLRLTEDVFNNILEEVLARRALKRFSATCRHIRQLCMPVLFRRCVVTLRAPISSRFLPDALWPHVRVLEFIDKCGESRIMPAWSEAPSPVYGDEDALLCRAYDVTTLKNALWSMPQLSSVSFKSRYPGSPHILPWSVVQTVLAVPQSREFICDNYLLSHRSHSSGAIAIVAPAPLASFRYLRRDLPAAAHTYHWQAEKEALDVVLTTQHNSLEAIVLPSQPSPFETLASLSWASLRELSIRGQWLLVEPSTGYMWALMNMPKLRVLELLFQHPSSTLPQAIWPLHWKTAQPFPEHPWPDLERLTVSFPRVEDQVYTHLPSTLRSLTLRYVPHLACSRWSWEPTRPPWHVPPLPSQDLSRILSCCNVRELAELEIEYHVDESEGNLLKLVGTAFPALKSLKLLRYRPAEVVGSGMDVEALARTLGRLDQLHTIALHLDVPETPRRHYLPGLVSAYNFRSQDMEIFSLALDGAADIFAQSLAPSVKFIKMLRPTPSSHEWAIFRVIRQDSEGRPTSPFAQYDHQLTRPINPSAIIVIQPSPPVFI
ncbi:hypothetical protein OH77DRAFT_1308547 [Trametes cingulata]|nr:hypothetical protein OH77DRAFT_1308547 [Trametes cingulata]